MTRHLILFLVVGFGQLVALQPVPAAAQVTLPAELRGWAWSSTIGWISLSCANTTACAADGGVDYGVNVDDSGNLSGYGWSENIGWVSFEPTVGTPPSAQGNANGRARLDTATGVLEGWARACAATDGGDCSSTAVDPNAGGWDGWISLRGDNGSSLYTINLADNSTTTPASYGSDFAWGSTLVGWLGWGGVVARPEPVINYFQVVGDDEVTLGNTATLEWSIQGMDSCTASGGWTGAVASAGGVHQQNVTPPRGNTTFTLTCTRGSDTFTESLTILALPDINITAFSPPSNWTPPSVAYGTSVYNDVQFNIMVGSFGNITDTAPYEATFAGETVTGDMEITNGAVTFNPPITFDNIPYGTHDAEIEIDLPRPGVIAEDLPTATPDDEDVEGNRFETLDIEVPVPPANLTIDLDRTLIRSGQTVELTYTASSLWAGTCTVIGTGVDVDFTLFGDPAVTESDTIPSPELSSETAYTITCTETNTGDSFTETVTVEVVPTAEER
ncbi:MAG: hypothetical protein ACOC4E_02485 [Patescibacteria group bacterium]